jgi:hypothetical protein
LEPAALVVRREAERANIALAPDCTLGARVKVPTSLRFSNRGAGRLTMRS